MLAPIPSAAQNVRPPGHITQQRIDNAERRIESQGSSASTELWRDVRRGEAGISTAAGPEAQILIQSQGETWRAMHNGAVANYGGWLLIGVLSVITLFFLVRGRMRISGGRSGKVIPRFTLIQRVVHWSVAGLFILLAVSGLILLFGKYLLIPVIGASGFAIVASASMQGHNLFGPIFLFATLALLVTFIRGNGYSFQDLRWIAKGGGFFGGHASSHKYNFGEKTWFWWAIIMGLAVSASGFVLLFPDAIPDRETAQLANIVHAVAAILYMAFAIGHIYLGTLGMEGALEGMTDGTVDENWARDHHDLWWEEHRNEATKDAGRARVLAARRGDDMLGRVRQ